MRRLALALLAGFVTSVLAYLACHFWADRWTDLAPWLQVLIGVGFGLLIALTVLLGLAGRDKPKVTSARVASDMRSRDGVTMQDVTANDPAGRVEAVASNLHAREGRVEVRGVRYTQSGDAGDGRGSAR